MSEEIKDEKKKKKEGWTPEEWENLVRHEVISYVNAYLPMAKNFNLGVTYLPTIRSEQQANMIDGVVLHFYLDFGELIETDLPLPHGDVEGEIK